MKQKTLSALQNFVQQVAETSTLPEWIRMAATDLDAALCDELADDAHEIALEEEKLNREDRKRDKAERAEFFRKLHYEKKGWPYTPKGEDP